MKKKDRENFQKYVGRAFRGEDNIIRWIIHLSDRGYFHLRWFNETNKVWYNGGSIKAEKFDADSDLEVRAPQKGEAYLLCLFTTKEKTVGVD